MAEKKRPIVKREKKVKEKVERRCTRCGKEKPEDEFYRSSSTLNRDSKRMSVCKECAREIAFEFYTKDVNITHAIFCACRLLDIPFIICTDRGTNVIQNSIDKFADYDKTSPVYIQKIMGEYIRLINSLKQYNGFSFKDGETSFPNENNDTKEVIEENEVKTSKLDCQNEEDVIRLLHYDPFENENKQDRKFLFNKMVDFLNEEILEDPFKVNSVIEIVKMYNQIEYLNNAISTFTKDTGLLVENTGAIRELVATKKNLNDTAMKLAEVNGISEKFNTKKSVGAGTLSGMMKKLNEIGLESAEVNLFDIRTSEGMQQVAEQNANAIMKRLMLDESDMADMLAESRRRLENLQNEKDEIEEELRLLKIKLKEYEEKEREEDCKEDKKEEE